MQNRDINGGGKGMIKKRVWILVGIYFILGLVIGYFTSIRADLPKNIYMIFDDAIPVIVLILLCVIFSKTRKDTWRNSIGLGVGLAFGYDIYWGVSSYLNIGSGNTGYIIQAIIQALFTIVGVVVIVLILQMIKSVFIKYITKKQ